MTTYGRETPEAEAIRMEAIKVKKAQLDAMVEALKKQEAEANQIGRQISAALRKAAEDAIHIMREELAELYLRTVVAPQKAPETRKCLNTELHEVCESRMPTRFHTRCDLCDNTRNRI